MILSGPSRTLARMSVLVLHFQVICRLAVTDGGCHRVRWSQDIGLTNKNVVFEQQHEGRVIQQSLEIFLLVNLNHNQQKSCL